MGRLVDFLSLTGPEKALIVTVSVLLAISRVLLPIARLDPTRWTINVIAGSLPPYEPITQPNLVPWAVTAVDSTLPISFSCLMQALVAESIFSTHGYSSRVCFGVTTDNGDLSAHAWVEQDGRVVLGELEDLSQYQRLGNGFPAQNGLF